MSDLTASGPDPGATYTVTGSLPGVYHEDRVIVSEVGSTSIARMFRVYGATFSNGVWTYVDVETAYATVQNTDGSIQYFTYSGTNEWLTSAWQGSGNNTVHNALDYGLVEGEGQSDATRGANVAAIQSAVDAAIANSGSSSGGGKVVIPAGTYELGGIIDDLAPTILVANVTGGLVIRGESAGTRLIQYGTIDGTANIAEDIFDVSNAGNPGQFGVRFRELTLKYATGLTVPAAGASAINCLNGAAYVTAEQCGFYNCPQAFATGSESHAGLLSGLINCTVYQDQNGYSNSTQVVLGAPEAFVINTDILQQSPTAVTGCVGIAVQGQAEGCRIYGGHISYPSTGILVTDGAVFTYITDCEVDCASGLTIATQSDSAMIYGTYVTSCKFGVLYAPPSPTSGIFIDTAGGPNTNVEGIFIVNCIAYGYENAGLQINQGQSISVTGGKYSSNGKDPTSPALGAGIAITGPCADVRIVGADCSGIFNFLAPDPPQQPYGISVANGVTGVVVNSCNLAGNATLPLYVPANGTDLRVTDCTEYNDQGRVVKSTAPSPSAPFNGATFGYYGPVTFYASNTTEATISQIAIQSNNTNLLSGTFTLAAGKTPVASIDWNGTGSPNFLMIGQ